MDDLISVIVPIYNVEKYLNITIDSVINQTYENLEIILVDDGSTDKSGDICNEYAQKDKRIKVIHKKNGGISDARNTGIMYANGNYITWLDGDDFLQKQGVELLYKAIKKSRKDIAIGKIKLIYDYKDIKNENERNNKPNLVFEKEESIRQLLLNQLYSNEINAKMYTKRVLEKIEFPNGKEYEDLATVYKIFFKSNGVIFVDEYIYNYYFKREDSIMNQKFKPSRMDAFYFTLEIIEFMNENFKSLKDEAIIRAYIEARNILVEIPDKKYSKEKSILLGFIKNNKKVILKKNLPCKLKISLLPTLFGEKGIKFAWKVKKKIKTKERL